MEKKIRGGALIARALKDKGINKVFTLSGGFCNPAIEGFMECQIDVVNCPHEQIAGHLADGHTRITRKPFENTSRSLKTQELPENIQKLVQFMDANRSNNVG